MHELSVTENILEIALRHATQANASRVTDVYLTIGRLSSIVDDSVQFYWDIVGEDTLCKGATLHFKRIPARLLCLNCHNEFELEDELIPCPRCGSAQLKVLTGEEFYVDSIGVEMAEKEAS
jgi:hydrogenase nickel incorporation protein HypA/HybF